jgi:hypothetical protein
MAFERRMVLHFMCKGLATVGYYHMQCGGGRDET